MSKRKIVIYPGFGTVTHEALHLKLISFMNADSYRYYDVGKLGKFNIAEKIQTYLTAIYKFTCLNIFKNNRNNVGYKGIVISHSIIESFITSHTTGRFIFNSKKTFDLIVQAIRFVNSSLLCFEQNEVLLLIGGDEAYLHGSILAQISINKNIKTIFVKQSDKNVSGFPFNIKTLYAGPNFAQYPNYFSKLELSSDDLSKFEEEIKNAVSGNANYYFLRNQNTPVPELDNAEKEFVKDAVIMFLHDFIDSPGIYGNCVFFDQWEWINETVKVLEKNNRKLIIKIHPNVSERNKPAIRILKEQYQNNNRILFIEKKTSLASLQELGMAGVLTLFGSVIVECAYLGIDCISAANNPYIGYGISQNATSKKDFRKKLHSLCNGTLGAISNLKEKSIKAYIVNRLVYSENHLIKNFPYDDMDRNLFLELYPEITNASNFGINERREVYLHSDIAQKFVSEKLKAEEENLLERFNFIKNNS